MNFKNIRKCFFRLIKKEMNIPDCEFSKACRRGDFEFVQAAINSDNNQPVWYGLLMACLHRQYDVAKILAERLKVDPSSYSDKRNPYWLNSELNHGLAAACRSGDCNIAQLMIDEGATAINRGLGDACSHQNIEAIIFMLEKHALTCFDYYIKKAIKEGNNVIVDLLTNARDSCVKVNEWCNIHGCYEEKWKNNQRSMICGIFLF